MDKVSLSTAPAQCHICGTTISRRADLQRHLKTHVSNKEALKHHCPKPGCNYKTLQLSNLKTHQKLHTGERNKVCPDCDFRTTDPATLTRHRKSSHGYVPPARQYRGSKSSLSQSTSRGHSPYSPRRFLSPASSLDKEHLSAPSPKSLSSVEDFVQHFPHHDQPIYPVKVPVLSSYEPLLEQPPVSEQAHYQSLFEASYPSLWVPDATTEPIFYTEPYWPMTIFAPVGGEFHQQVVVDNPASSHEDLLWNPELQFYLDFGCQDMNSNEYGFENPFQNPQSQPNQLSPCYTTDSHYLFPQQTFSTPSPWAEWSFDTCTL